MLIAPDVTKTLKNMKKMV